MPTLDLQIGAGDDDVFHSPNAHTITKDRVNVLIGRSSGMSRFDSAMRFIEVTIPQGATIDVSFMTFTAWRTDLVAAANATIQVEDVDASAQIADESDWHTRSMTSSTINWDNIEPFTLDVEHNTPSLNSILQELVDRPGFNEIVHFFWLNNVSDASAIRTGYSYDNTPSKATKLHIEYTEPAAAIGNRGANVGSSWLLYR